MTGSFSQGDPLGGQLAAIVYGKGQATLAMFENWLGADRFQAGVRRYMAKHAWGNATGEDFVAALAQATPNWLRPSRLSPTSLAFRA